MGAWVHLQSHIVKVRHACTSFSSPVDRQTGSGRTILIRCGCRVVVNYMMMNANKVLTAVERLMDLRSRSQRCMVRGSVTGVAVAVAVALRVDGAVCWSRCFIHKTDQLAQRLEHPSWIGKVLGSTAGLALHFSSYSS